MMVAKGVYSMWSADTTLKAETRDKATEKSLGTEQKRNETLAST